MPVLIKHLLLFQESNIVNSTQLNSEQNFFEHLQSQFQMYCDKNRINS